MRSFVVGLITVLIVFCSRAAHAQTSNIPTDPYGRIFAADIGTGVFGRAVATAGTQPIMSITPSFRYSDNAWSAGLGFAYARQLSASRAYKLAATYGYINPDGSDHLNRAALTGALQFFRNNTFTATGIATYGRVFDSYSNAGLILAVDQTLPRNFTLTYNAAWARVDVENGATVDDFQPGVGLSYEFETVPWGLAVDYTFDNDVDEESSWSIAVERALGATAKFNVGFEKHDVLTAKYTKTF